jgi:hypothetical protein
MSEAKVSNRKESPVPMRRKVPSYSIFPVPTPVVRAARTDCTLLAGCVRKPQAVRVRP